MAADADQIIIHSPDTDVLLISLCHQQSIDAKLYINPGSRLISVSAIESKLDADTCQALIGLHVFTGCDSVSAFRNKGKVKVTSLLPHHKQTFIASGST